MEKSIQKVGAEFFNIKASLDAAKKKWQLEPKLCLYTKRHGLLQSLKTVSLGDDSVLLMVKIFLRKSKPSIFLHALFGLNYDTWQNYF